MKPIVKICGLQSAGDLSCLSGAPVDYAGFVLAPSKRQVSIAQLRELVMQLPPGITPVAVTVNASVAKQREVIERTGITHLQLHGDEDAAHCRTLKKQLGSQLQLIKALPARGERTLRQISQYSGVADALLIDTYQPGQRGGSGKTFHWRDIPAYKAACRMAGLPLWIAGGLTPGNVGELIKNYAPDGVDVSSGVERGSGKEKELIRQFIKRVRQYDIEDDRA